MSPNGHVENHRFCSDYFLISTLFLFLFLFLYSKVTCVCVSSFSVCSFNAVAIHFYLFLSIFYVLLRNCQLVKLQNFMREQQTTILTFEFPRSECVHLSSVLWSYKVTDDISLTHSVSNFFGISIEVSSPGNLVKIEQNVPRF